MGLRGRPRMVTVEDVRRLHDAGFTIDEMMIELGCGRSTITLRRAEAGIAGLARSTTRSRPRTPGARGMPTRHADPKRQPRRQRRGKVELAADHPAVVEARPLFRGSSVAAAGRVNVLVSGINHWKIGREVKKGRWRGFPIYCLTLEERTTCPRSCGLWTACYGNSMVYAKRIVAGAELESRLVVDVAALAVKHPRGFVVRLHILGDFYSVEYVRLWERLSIQHPQLHVFGFTARKDPGDPIAAELRRVIGRRWRRFAVRFSGETGPRSAVTVDHAAEAPVGSILCPQQQGKTQSCSTCALCWGTDRAITFIKH